MSDDGENRKSIKYYMKRYLLREQERFRGKTVVDLPTGTGFTARILHEIGAKVLPFDLFPEYFKVEGLECGQADVMKRIPLADNSVDVVICQEGIEHFPDQNLAMREFARILKVGGSLIVTTPNYSNLGGRFSYLMSESETFNKHMPPNELDSVWMSDDGKEREPYFGHIFLIGIQKMRILGKLNGFELRGMEKTRHRSTSLILFPLLYPLICLTNWYAYRRNMRKNKRIDEQTKREVYGEQYRLGTSLRTLLDSHLFLEMVKTEERQEALANISSVQKDFSLK